MLAALHRRFGDPAYTGPNRCPPCTAVNLALALALAVLAWLAWPPAALPLLAGALVAIWLRGYLVPGTPTLTRRYLPERVLAAFGAGPTEEPDDVEAFLRELGVVVDAGDDIALAPGFEAVFRAEAVTFGDVTPDAEWVAYLLGVDPARVYVTERGDGRVARVDGLVVGAWASPAAFVADLAADRVLRMGDETWARAPLSLRGEVLGGLRVCHERCPTCGGRIEIDLDGVASCCHDFEVIAGTCATCRSRLFEVPTEGAALEAAAD